jgi:hypothetical protein
MRGFHDSKLYELIPGKLHQTNPMSQSTEETTVVSIIPTKPKAADFDHGNLPIVALNNLPPDPGAVATLSTIGNS